MSFFNKVLASVGVGSASVDTKLERDSFYPGEMAKGVIGIKGGKTEQKIDQIYLALNTTYIRESDDKKYTTAGVIDKYRIAETLVIQPNETREIPFSIQIPEDSPLTLGRTKVWISTGLDIKNAVDPGDKDYISIKPNRLMDGVFQAVSDLGFRLREAECEEAPRRLRGRLPFIQEFEFVPVSGTFRGKLDELELVFRPAGGGQMELMLQVDRKARGLGGFLSEALEMDETNVRLRVSDYDLAGIRQQLENTISRYC
ncbi:sporulation protein [Bacillus infantis]|uniref:sporulation protein n=1 Tax=Bacillus infantis TaxID=324767 RepID=UPI003CF53FE0